jgi:hypothetical protein
MIWVGAVLTDSERADLDLGLVRDRSRLMDRGSPAGRLETHETPELVRFGGRSQPLRRNLRILRRILREHRLDQEPVSEHTQVRLCGVAVLDMVAVAWGIAGLDRFDPTSTLGSAITLGGHPRLILIMAVAGFAMLAGLAADEGVQPRYRARVRATHRRLRDFRRRAGRNTVRHPAIRARVCAGRHTASHSHRAPRSARALDAGACWMAASTASIDSI